jgi:hypothetical protein
MVAQAPFGNENSTVLIDQMIGTAYHYVRIVADNIAAVKHVSAHLQAIYELNEHTTEIDALYANLTQMLALYENLEAILAVADGLEDVSVIAENIDAIKNIDQNMAALLVIEANLPTILYNNIVGYFPAGPVDTVDINATDPDTYVIGATIGGFVLSEGSSVFRAKFQGGTYVPDPENGIWVVQNAGPAIRRVDANTGPELAKHAVQIQNGDHIGETWMIVEGAIENLGVTPITGTLIFPNISVEGEVIAARKSELQGVTYESIGARMDVVDQTITKLSGTERVFEAQDMYGYIVIYMTSDGKIVSLSNFQIIPNEDGFELQDKYGGTLARFSKDGTAYFAGTRLKISENPLEVTDFLGNLLFTLDPSGSMTVAGLKLKIGPVPLDISDQNGFSLARFNADGSFNVAGLKITIDSQNALILTDSLGYTLIRISRTGEVVIGGLTIKPDTREGIEYYDQWGFITQRNNPVRSMLHGLYIDSKLPGRFEVQDYLGFILWRPGLIGSTEAEAQTEIPQPLDRNLYMGRYIYTVEDQPIELVPGNLLEHRADAALVSAALFPLHANLGVRARSFQGSTTFTPSEWTDGAHLTVYPSSLHPEDEQGISELRLTMRTATLADLLAAPDINILLVGDSISTYQMIYYMVPWFDEWGLGVGWSGTTETEGGVDDGGLGNHFEYDLTLKGENRPGIEIADYTYYLTATVSPVAIGGEAAYLADTLTNRRLKNPFLVIDDGVVPDAHLRNGYFMDFAAYFSRFSVPEADMLMLVMGRNDIRRLTVSTAYDLIYSELKLIIDRWRVYDATKPVVFMLPNTARSEEEDADYPQEVEAYKVMLDLMNDLADPNVHFVFPHAHIPNTSGFNMSGPSGVTSPQDTRTRVYSRHIEDGIHIYNYTREECARLLAMAGAYAITNVV